MGIVSSRFDHMLFLNNLTAQKGHATFSNCTTLSSNLCVTVITGTLVTRHNTCKNLSNQRHIPKSATNLSFKAVTAFLACAKIIVTPNIAFSRICHWPASFGQYAMRFLLPQQQFFFLSKECSTFHFYKYFVFRLKHF